MIGRGLKESARYNALAEALVHTRHLGSGSTMRPTRSLKRIAGLLAVSFVRTVRDDGFGRASQMAYSALFSVFPALLILAAIFQRLGSEALWDDLRLVADAYLPPEMAATLDRGLRDLMAEPLPAALTFGSLTLVWVASGFRSAVLKGLSIAYPQPRARRLLSRRLIALWMVIVLGVATSLSFNLFVFGVRIARVIEEPLGLSGSLSHLLSVLRWPFAFLSMTGSMILLYAIVPVERLRLRMVWPGAVTFSVLWLLMTAALSAYLSISLHIPRVYGAITGIIMLLLWFYLTSLLLFYGAEVNATWMSVREEVARKRQQGPANSQRDQQPNRPR